MFRDKNVVNKADWVMVKRTKAIWHKHEQTYHNRTRQTPNMN